MLATLLHLIKSGTVSAPTSCPDLPEYARGLPTVTDAPCTDCGLCVTACPTAAIQVADPGHVRLDLGACIACGLCTQVCPSGTLQNNRSTQAAVTRREDLVREAGSTHAAVPGDSIFARSLHVREVSTGDNATDLEVAATGNAIFDVGRFGVHIVASPRHADALLVTGPVGLAMQEPLRRCYDAMAEPRMVIAAGAGAISGGLHRGGYAQANGVDAVLPVDVYIPGHPPHPWMLIHGLLLAMQQGPTGCKSR